MRQSLYCCTRRLALASTSVSSSLPSSAGWPSWVGDHIAMFASNRGQYPDISYSVSKRGQEEGGRTHKWSKAVFIWLSLRHILKSRECITFPSFPSIYLQIGPSLIYIFQDVDRAGFRSLQLLRKLAHFESFSNSTALRYEVNGWRSCDCPRQELLGTLYRNTRTRIHQCRPSFTQENTQLPTHISFTNHTRVSVAATKFRL